MEEAVRQASDYMIDLDLTVPHLFSLCKIKFHLTPPLIQNIGIVVEFDFSFLRGGWGTGVWGAWGFRGRPP